MRRAIGAVLVLIGSVPLMGIAAFYWVFARHMYTIAFSADARGVTFLLLLPLIVLSCFGGGIYLLSRPRISN